MVRPFEGGESERSVKNVKERKQGGKAGNEGRKEGMTEESPI